MKTNNKFYLRDKIISDNYYRIPKLTKEIVEPEK